jgi:hypothetical protein
MNTLEYGEYSGPNSVFRDPRPYENPPSAVVPMPTYPAAQSSPNTLDIKVKKSIASLRLGISCICAMQVIIVILVGCIYAEIVRIRDEFIKN